MIDTTGTYKAYQDFFYNNFNFGVFGNKMKWKQMERQEVSDCLGLLKLAPETPEISCAANQTWSTPFSFSFDPIAVRNEHLQTFHFHAAGQDWLRDSWNSPGSSDLSQVCSLGLFFIALDLQNVLFEFQQQK